MHQQELDSIGGAIVRIMRDPVVVLDREFRVRTANPAFYRNFSTDPDNVLGRVLFDVAGGRWDTDVFRAAFEQALNGEAGNREVTVEQSGPDHRTSHIVLSAQRLQDTEDGLIVAIMQDVTVQIRAQAEVARSNRELERFAYVASHDLQEPLRMVASYTRLLGEKYQGQLDERADRYISYAVDGAERMKKLINDLLAYSRVGSQPMNVTPVNCTAVVYQVLSDLGLRIEETQTVINVGELPRVLGDASQLRQLFQNLLENGIKFSGGKRPQIAVTAERSSGAYWTIRVHDQGIGIEPQHYDRVFVIFQRLHGRDMAGTGIGLALCKRIVERHGGRLWVESTPGVGSTFFFTLRAAEQE